jgi:branched-chain amino acid transport system substrate-binding protein
MYARRSRGILVALVCGAALGIGGCGDSDSGSGASGAGGESKDPIVIGYAGGFTGDLAFFDDPAYKGAEIAVEEINKAGGVDGRPLELIKADTKSDINQGSRAGLELVQKDVDAMLVTPDFNFGGGAAREAQKAGKLVISVGAGAPKFGVQGIGPLAYTMGISGVTDGAASAEWAVEKKQFKTAYLLLDDVTDYDKDQCRGFETRFKELGGQIVGKDTFKNGDPSVASQVTRIKRLGAAPDLISLCSFPPGGAVAVKQLRDAGVEAAIVSNGAMDGDYWFEKTVPDLSDFYFLSSASMWGNDPSEAVNDFVATFKAKAGQPQNTFPLFAYAAVKGIAVAVEQAGSTEGTALAGVFNKFKAQDLVIPVTFTPELHIDTAREERIIGVQDGKHEVDDVRGAKKAPPLFEQG